MSRALKLLILIALAWTIPAALIWIAVHKHHRDTSILCCAQRIPV